MARSEIQGMRELERMFERLEKVPQKVATKAARAGATIAYRDAKQNAPVDTGDLKNALVLKPERRTKVGKKVYDVMVDPMKNEIFVKTTTDGTRYYYPASQEYGFMTVDGGFVPGYRYLRNAMTNNVRKIETRVVEVATKEVEKIINAR